MSAAPPGRYFEGEIDYDVSYESHQNGLSIAQLELMYGVKEQFFISGGRYKTMTDGQVIEMQLYDPGLNRVYTKLAESDTLIFFEGAINRDSIRDFSIQPNADTVLGHSCQSVTFKSLSGTSTFFYSEDFPLDAGKFRAQQFANWAFYCEKAHAVPLKMVVRNEQWTMTAVATEIRPFRIDSSFFQTPGAVMIPGKN